jgi:RiboL-PSP-HEPN
MKFIRDEAELSHLLNSDLSWRRKELSDLKSAINKADLLSKNVLLRALAAMCYAHFEGYIKYSMIKYFYYVTSRRLFYREINKIYRKNRFYATWKALISDSSYSSFCRFFDKINNAENERFTKINSIIVDPQSNLNFERLCSFCERCGVDPSDFKDDEIFVDRVLLKRRNAIAHGEDEMIGREEMDQLVDNVLSLMSRFSGHLENRLFSKICG